MQTTIAQRHALRGINAETSEAAISECEHVIIRMALDFPKDFGQIRALVEPEFFAHPILRDFYTAFCEAHNRGMAPDIIRAGERAVEIGSPANLVAEKRCDLFVQYDPPSIYSMPSIAAQIREGWQRRELHKSASALAERIGSANGSLPDMVADNHADINIILERSRDPALRRTLLNESTKTSSEIAAVEIERPASIVGDGVITRSDFVLLYGRPGLGKSWHALQLCLAACNGESWAGLAPSECPVSVGLVQLELPDWSLRERIVALGAQHDSFHILCYPHMPIRLDLCEPSHIGHLADWITSLGLGLVIIDAFSRSHTADENDAMQIGAMIARIDALRRQTNAAVCLWHHERKPAPGAKDDDDLAALRGTSRLQSDPTVLIRVITHANGHVLRFVKVTNGPTPDDVFFVKGPQGFPVVADPPEARSDRMKALVLAVLDTGRMALPTAVIAQQAGVGLRTAQRYLGELVRDGLVRRDAQGKTALFISCSPPPPNQFGE